MWTDDELATAEAMLRDGESMVTIASALGRTYASVVCKLREIRRTVKRERQDRKADGAPPHDFASALRRFESWTTAGTWLDSNSKAAFAMAARNWVVVRKWPLLIEGLERECGVTVTVADLQEWARKRGAWEGPAKKPVDWRNLPDIEAKIRRIVCKKTKDFDAAEDAASYAVLQMMEYSQPYVGYGVSVAFNYLNTKARRTPPMAYLDDEAVRQAIDMRLFTAPSQIVSVELNEVLRAGLKLPGRFRETFLGMCREDSDEMIGDRLGVGTSRVQDLKALVRHMLRDALQPA